MTAPAYNQVKAGYVSVLLHVSSVLKLALADASLQSGRTQRDLYHLAIADFIAWHKPSRRGQKPKMAVPARASSGVYKPLYRDVDAIPLRMWIKKELLDEVEDLARFAHIQRREFIYSALVRRFGPETQA